jgi:hypothetical protein
MTIRYRTARVNLPCPANWMLWWSHARRNPQPWTAPANTEDYDR